jgi:hypothetical protein
MYHVFADIRISRKLTAHVVTNASGEILGQFRTINEAFACLLDNEAHRFELHGPETLYTLILTGTAEVSEDAAALGEGFSLAPWNNMTPDPGS